MTPRQRTLAAIRGEPHDRVPVAQHNFAFAAKHVGITMKEFAFHPDKAAHALACTAEDFGYDGIIIDFDTCALAEAMGATITFPGDAPAHIETSPLETIQDAAHLRIPDPHKDGRLPLWLETTRLLRGMVGDELAIMGRADQGPFSLLGVLRDPQAIMMDLIDEPEEDIFAGLEICTAAGAAFARAQLEAGADITSIGDGLSGESLISPAMYRKFSQPFERRYKELLGDGLLSLHICGRSNNIIEDMVATGSDVLELDHLNDMDRSFGIVANRCCIFGNIDPSSVLCMGTPELVREKCRALIASAHLHGARFVLCPGCLVMANTPPENVQAMTDAAREFGTKPYAHTQSHGG
jgi:uroporphyrinogen decarboxylase